MRPAGSVVLGPGADSAHGTLRLDSRAPAAGPVLSLLLSSLLFCRRCFLVDAAAPFVVAAPVAASFADPVAASSLRVPRTFGILGSLGMAFRRGRQLIRVSRPIGSPSRHTPEGMRVSVPGGRIRALPTPQDTPPVAFATHLQTPACIRYAGSVADQRFWRRVSFNSR